MAQVFSVMVMASTRPCHDPEEVDLEPNPLPAPSRLS